MSANFQIATVEGRPVHFLDAGEPAATNVLLLAHAFPVGARLFEPQLGAFPGWRVIAPAFPGFDGTPTIPSPSIDAYARTIAGLLRSLRVPRAVVGGVSMGGHLTFAMLRQAPDLVGGIVLADTRSQADSEEAKTGRRALMKTLYAQGATAVAEAMLPRLLGETTRRSRADVVARVRQLIEGQSTEGIAGAIRVLMERPDSTPLLAGITVPALVVVGSEDPLSPPAEMRQLAAAIPGSEFVELPNAGHLANLEVPDAFNAALAAWLSALGSRL
jgi:3-oxoadipate enol-lactonase